MKNTLLLILALFFFTSCKMNEKQSTSQKFNTDAISMFWKVTEHLKKDRPLNDSLWNSYHNLKGNIDYMENNRSEEQFVEHRRFLELIFRPSFADSLNQIIKRKKYQNNDIFQNLIYIKNNEKALKQYTKTITSPNYYKDCISLSQDYLPKNKYEKIPKDLTIYIQAITYDAAVQDNNMYFGLSVVHDFDKLKKGIVAAHELHHVLRKNKSLKNVLSQKDSASYFVINQINNEGVADLIDKDLVTKFPNKTLMGPLFTEWLLGDAKNTITKIDSCLSQNAESEGKYVSKNDFTKIIAYSSGHIPGLFMVKIIKQNGFFQELIDNSDNPFNFFYLYNKAAKKDIDKPPVLGEKTIKYLHVLEKKAFK